MRTTTASAALALFLALGIAPAAPAQEHAHHGAVGASVDDLVAIAKAMNPDLQVVALEADAAAARVEGAGSLMDPKVQVVYEDWPKNTTGGSFPNNSTSGVTKKLRVFQDLPFWGKRDLKREIAEAGSRKAAVLKKQVENDLVAKVKSAYAEYHQAHLVIDLARDLNGRLETLSKLARARYGQSLGKQQDVTRVEVERSMLQAEIARTQGERAKARAKINRLLARPVDAPLVEAPAPRPIPPMESLDLPALVARAQTANPDILAQQAVIEGADKSVGLAERSWYPDFEVGLGAVRRQGDLDSYEAMVTMNVPLRWGLRESEIGETKAMAAAARARREARAIELGNEVADAWIALKSAREVETLLRESQLPQAEIGFQTAAKSYELGRSEFVDVLMTEQQLWKSNIDLIKVQFEQQMRLAELEKLVGGEL
ncbi:MAG: TolC family protein [Solirubrobacterales bacterium]